MMMMIQIPCGHFLFSDGGGLGRLKNVRVSDKVRPVCSEVLLYQR